MDIGDALVAAEEIAKLRARIAELEAENDRFRKALETIAGCSADKLQAVQAQSTLDWTCSGTEIGP